MPVAQSILGEGAKAVARMSAITGESTGAIAERLAESKVVGFFDDWFTRRIRRISQCWYSSPCQFFFRFP
jgi:hypothetical protein